MVAATQNEACSILVTNLDYFGSLDHLGHGIQYFF